MLTCLHITGYIACIISENCSHTLRGDASANHENTKVKEHFEKNEEKFSFNVLHEGKLINEIMRKLSH